MEHWEAQLKAQEEKDSAERKKKEEEQEARNSGRPQLLNLHEDAVLDRKIFLDLSKHTNAKVGRKNPEDPDNMPEICLGGVGIQLQHCTFETTKDGTFITP